MFSVQAVLDYIEERLHEPIGLDEIAARAYVSQPQLYRLFHSSTGHPVKEYIRKRRVSVAAQLLMNTERSIQDIAYDTGFDSYHSFTKTFKKLTGVTPGVYKSTASAYFSFEPIRLTAEQSDHEPVKIVSLPSDRAFAFDYVSAERDGLEPSAFRMAYESVLSWGWNPVAARFFGHDAESSPDDGSGDRHNHRYRIMVMPPDHDDGMAGEGWQSVSFPGGLYAVTTASADCPETIVGAWNRLLSEWLPGSKFASREGPFVEEYIHYKGKLARMRLYLPIRPRSEHPFITTAQVGERTIAYAKAFGPNAYEEADAALTDWIKRSGCLQGQAECRFYMSSGCDQSGAEWWEAGIAREGAAPADRAVGTKQLGGGEYACLTTEAYGNMKGVVELLRRWLDQQSYYAADPDRQRFTEYYTRQGYSLDRIRATCYYPIRRGD